jgi:phosphopantetheine adenylyltransferase
VSPNCGGIRGHITHGHVLPSISSLFVTLQLLVLEKQARGVKLITIGKVIYRLVTRTFAIQFKNTFVKHFNPHQFGVATSNRCEIVVHGVRAMLDIHLEWVVL